MVTFPDRTLVTPFGEANCWERVDQADESYWVCWIVETGICFWFNNWEVRSPEDWSFGRYQVLPFKIDPERKEHLNRLGQFHTYWRENIMGAPTTRQAQGVGPSLPGRRMSQQIKSRGSKV